MSFISQEGSTFRRVCQNGEISRVQDFLRAGVVHVDVAQPDGCTGLWLAAENGHGSVIALLAANGADVDVRKEPGNVPAIYVASQNGHRDAVEALLRCGANPNAAKDTGATALFIAAQQNHEDIVFLLLQSGASVHVHTAQGFTPLMIAAYQGNAGCVVALVESGANANEVVKGKTPEEWAESNGHGQRIAAALNRVRQSSASRWSSTLPTPAPAPQPQSIARENERTRGPSINTNNYSRGGAPAATRADRALVPASTGGEVSQYNYDSGVHTSNNGHTTYPQSNLRRGRSAEGGAVRKATVSSGRGQQSTYRDASVSQLRDGASRGGGSRRALAPPPAALITDPAPAALGNKSGPRMRGAGSRPAATPQQRQMTLQSYMEREEQANVQSRNEIAKSVNRTTDAASMLHAATSTTGLDLSQRSQQKRVAQEWDVFMKVVSARAVKLNDDLSDFSFAEDWIVNDSSMIRKYAEQAKQLAKSQADSMPVSYDRRRAQGRNGANDIDGPDNDDGEDDDDNNNNNNYDNDGGDDFVVPPAQADLLDDLEAFLEAGTGAKGPEALASAGSGGNRAQAKRSDIDEDYE